MKLKQNVKSILSLEENKIHLCFLTGVSYSTLHRWLRDDHEKLTMKKVIEAIVEITGFSEDDLFQTDTVKEVLDTL